jgi:hypothetical protein
MAERKEDWQSRGFQVFGPNLRLDIRNPQLGLNGADVLPGMDILIIRMSTSPD